MGCGGERALLAVGAVSNRVCFLMCHSLCFVEVVLEQQLHAAAAPNNAAELTDTRQTFLLAFFFAWVRRTARYLNT